MDKDGERIVVAAARESVQQLFIAVHTPLRRGQLVAKLAKTGGECGTTHDCVSKSRSCCHLVVVADQRRFDNTISPCRIHRCFYPSLKRERRTPSLTLQARK
jgi:hypothetical protein